MLTDFVQGFGSAVNTMATSLSGGDVAMKGIISVMILGGLGTLLAVCRKVPSKIWRLFISRVSVSVEFTNSWMYENRELFEAAGDFVANRQSKKLYKILTARLNDKALSTALGVSVSTGFFFCNGKPVWYALENAKEQGAVPESITIRTLGRTSQVVLDMIEAEKKLLKNYTRRNFYIYEKEWKKVCAIPTRDRVLFLKKEVKEALDRKINFFKNNRAWFEERSINHKLLIILDGPPGTGKSAISRYVADKLGWSLGTISTPIGFEDAVRKAADSDMVVSVPDVDALGLAGARSGVAGPKLVATAKTDEDKPSSGIEIDVSSGSVKLSEVKTESGKEKPEKPADAADALSKIMTLELERTAAILNLFQGDLPLNNSVVVMSTNCIDKLDGALLRPSRCDLKLHIGELGYDEVNAFRNHYYGEAAEGDLSEAFQAITIRACDIMEGFTDNPDNIEGFDTHIAKYN